MLTFSLFFCSDFFLNKQGSREGSVSSWALVSDFSVSRTVGKDTNFLLRNGEVSLFVSVSPLPHFNLTEQVVDPKTNKFTLRLSSETSVWENWDEEVNKRRSHCLHKNYRFVFWKRRIFQKNSPYIVSPPSPSLQLLSSQLIFKNRTHQLTL